MVFNLFYSFTVVVSTELFPRGDLDLDDPGLKNDRQQNRFVLFNTSTGVHGGSAHRQSGAAEVLNLRTYIPLPG